MRCPSCGAVHSSEDCPESVTAQATLPAESEPALLLSDQAESETTVNDHLCEALGASPKTNHSSRLIEFPGVSRASMPPWRKELSKRVREVQEKRAREAALADEAAENQHEELPGAAQPQLELLPQSEQPQVNPIVTAALRRIERAHQATQPQTRSATMVADDATGSRNSVRAEAGRNTAIGATATVTAVARSTNNRQAIPIAATAAAPVLENEILPIDEPAPAPAPERSLNLVVTPSPMSFETNSEPRNSKPKPKRVIADNDPVLSYLDSIATSAEIVVPTETRSPVFARLAAAFVDLLAVAFFSLPFAAILEMQNANWHDHRVAGTMGGIVTVVMFIYLTVSIALTGRTFGLRLFSLRAIDVKTGLIPTGKQSASRAFLFILSLATLGIGFCYALVNSERQAAHDRLSRTAIVRV